MVLLVYLEGLDAQRVSLQDRVTITAESARIGGSQVYLKEGEVFSVEDLLYALIVQSANDAATALAIHYAGSKEAFVEVMNQRAQAMGMKDTVFHSVHGLPPGKGQLPDVSTPRDLARLSQELLKHPDVLMYTSVRERPFRETSAEPFIMRSHNRLLNSMDGCDGLKTGYFRQAGFSIAATAQKKGVRAIAVVLGSENRKVRDGKAKELLSKGLMRLMAAAPAKTPPPPAAVQPEGAAAREQDAPAARVEEEKSNMIQIRKSTFFLLLAIAGGIIVLLAALLVAKTRDAKPRGTYLR